MVVEKVFNDMSLKIRSIIIDNAYFGLMLAGVNCEVDEHTRRTSTACVYRDELSTKLVVNTQDWISMDENKRIGTLLHEIFHICELHLTMRRDFPDKALFNLAADIQVNQDVAMINKDYVDEKWVTINSYPGAIDPVKDKDKGTRYYYYKLKENLESKNPCKNLKAQYESEDKFIIYIEGGGDPSQAGANGQQSVTDHTGWKAFDVGQMEPGEARIVETLIQAQMIAAWQNSDEKSRGTLPGHLRGAIEEWMKPKKSVFDWKGAVRRFTGGYSQETYTKKLRRKFNKRYPSLPGLKVKLRKRLLCAIDTSGSVTKKEYIDFMIEIDAIRRSGVEVTIVECDAYVDKQKGIYKFKGLKHVQDRLVTGGGGTSFDPPIEYLNEEANNYSALIYLTDGEAPVPKVKSKKPIMWVLSHEGKAKETWIKEGAPGYVIKIPPDEVAA